MAVNAWQSDTAKMSRTWFKVPDKVLKFLKNTKYVWGILEAWYNTGMYEHEMWWRDLALKFNLTSVMMLNDADIFSCWGGKKKLFFREKAAFTRPHHYTNAWFLSNSQTHERYLHKRCADTSAFPRILFSQNTLFFDGNHPQADEKLKGQLLRTKKLQTHLGLGCICSFVYASCCIVSCFSVIVSSTCNTGGLHWGAEHRNTTVYKEMLC